MREDESRDTGANRDTGAARDDADGTTDLLDPYLRGADEQVVAESGPVTLRRAPVAYAVSLLPPRVRYRALAVDLSVERTRVAPNEGFDFSVTVRNRAPVAHSVALSCATLWGWYLDDHPEAETGDPYASDPRRVWLRGRQSYTFERRWSGYLRTDAGYEELSPGPHTLVARLHVPDADEMGLADAVEFYVEE